LKYRIEAGTRAYWLPQYRFGAVPAAAARAAAGFAASARRVHLGQLRGLAWRRVASPKWIVARLPRGTH
jgi:hypothetical protein